MNPYTSQWNTYDINELRQPDTQFNDELIGAVPHRSYQLVVAVVTQQVVVESFGIVVGSTHRPQRGR